MLHLLAGRTDSNPAVFMNRTQITICLLASCLSVSAVAQTVQFRDITAQAGIHFVHNNAAFGKKWLPETLGAGCAFIDYDNDGYPDILLVNGEDWPGHAKTPSTLKLYHNNHDGTFTDVTRKAGSGGLNVWDGCGGGRLRQ